MCRLVLINLYFVCLMHTAMMRKEFYNTEIQVQNRYKLPRTHNNESDAICLILKFEMKWILLVFQQTKDIGTYLEFPLTNLTIWSYLKLHQYKQMQKQSLKPWRSCFRSCLEIRLLPRILEFPEQMICQNNRRLMPQGSLVKEEK